MTATVPASQPISAGDLRQLLSEDPDLRILDVRTGGEFEGVHIPGSTNVPLDTLHEHARELADTTHPVVLVCKSGARADQAGSRLEREGRGALRILTGGLDAWIAAGGEVVEGASDRWAMDRQVRLVAGSLVLAGMTGGLAVPAIRLLAAGVGGGLVFSAVSNTCAMANLLGRLPYNRSSCDIEQVLVDLREQAPAIDLRTAQAERVEEAPRAS